MTKKSTKFSVALSQTAKPKRRGAPSKLAAICAHLIPKGEWQLFKESLVNADISSRAIQEALALTGIKVSLATVQRWRREAFIRNERDMALTEVAQLRGDK